MPYYCDLGHIVETQRDERCSSWSLTEWTRPTQRGDSEQLVTETLVEEVSIDGMCGVY